MFLIFQNTFENKIKINYHRVKEEGWRKRYMENKNVVAISQSIESGPEHRVCISVCVCVVCGKRCTGVWVPVHFACEQIASPQLVRVQFPCLSCLVWCVLDVACPRVLGALSNVV